MKLLFTHTIGYYHISGDVPANFHQVLTDLEPSILGRLLVEREQCLWISYLVLI